MIIKCYMIQNARSNLLISRDVDIEFFLKNPSSANKADLPQWMFINLKDHMQVKRNQLNYSHLHAIIIEYDSYNIAEFISLYKFAYYLHTTSSHSKENNKFRVIIPLKESIEYSFYHRLETRQAMQLYFPGIDPSCAVNFQKIPAYPANKADYFWYINKGELFDFSAIANKAKELIEFNEKIKKEKSKKEYSANINYEAYKQAALNNITAEYAGCGRCKTGHRYSDLCSYAGKLISAKYPDANYIFDDAEVESIILHEYSDNSIKKMLNAFLRNRK